MNDKIKYFIPKVLNRIAHEKNCIWEHLPVEKISLWGLGHVPAKNEFAKHLHEMLGVFTPEFFADIKLEDKETIIKCADQTLNHDFDLLGSGLMHLDPIPWHSDFKSGYTWQNGTFYRYQRGKTPKDSDIKIPRELNRCHQFLWLGEAYLITQDEKYASELVIQIDNWIDENPLMYSVNWECSMDVAIRAVNWLYALNFISASESFTDGFVARVNKLLYQHAFFIRNNLEKVIPFSNNHYFSDLVGLLYLGMFFRERCCGRLWLRYALKHYKKEVLIETMPSGVNYEKSVSYHRLMTELMVFPYTMLVRKGYAFDKKIKDRLAKTVSYINNYTKGNGNSPLVADNDDGRLLPFIYRDFRKHGYLTSEDSTEMRIALQRLTDSDWFSIEEKSSHLYPDANVVVLRAENSYLFTSCCHRWRYDKNTGGFVGTHLHNDLLSFVYSIGEHDFIIDPGTYLYTSDIENRNQFRSAKKHNTIVVDDEEQNILSETGAFNLQYNTNAKNLSYFSNEESECCEGEYTTINGRFTHRRLFCLGRERLEVKDTLNKEGKRHHAYMSFHLAENVTVKETNDGYILCSDGLMVRMGFSTKAIVQTRVIEDTVSPSYGMLRPSKTIEVLFDFDDRTEIITKFAIVQ